MASKTISPLNAFLMVCMISFWGSSFVVVKLVLQEGLTPIATATFRFLIAGALFLVTLFLNKVRTRSYDVAVEKKDLPTLLILALTGVTVFFTVQYTGIQMAGASIAAILVCLLSPILISLFSAILFGERLNRTQATGVGIAAVGTAFVIAEGLLGVTADAMFFTGSMILLATPFLWATYTLMGTKIMEKYSPFLVVAYVNVLGGILLVPFAFAEGSFNEIFTLNSYEWGAILFLAVTCSLIGYFIWFYVMKQAGAAVTSSFLFAEPLVTALLAKIFLDEPMTLLVAAGGLLIFVGVYFVTRKQKIPSLRQKT